MPVFIKWEYYKIFSTPVNIVMNNSIPIHLNIFARNEYWYAGYVGGLYTHTEEGIEVKRMQRPRPGRGPVCLRDLTNKSTGRQYVYVTGWRMKRPANVILIYVHCKLRYKSVLLIPREMNPGFGWRDKSLFYEWYRRE